MRTNFTPPHTEAIRLNNKQINSQVPARDSNIELLRLVAMFLIVLHHISTWGVCREVYGDGAALSIGASISQVLNGVLFVGVNVFILISGYYGIKLRWKSFLNLYLICAFYGLCGYLLQVFCGECSFGTDIVYSTLLIFSHCPWWFIGAYVGLMFLSPILNMAIEHMNHRQHLISLGLLTIMNVWFGYFYHYDMFSTHGFSVAQMVYIYWIGAYLHKYVTNEQIHKYRRCTLTGYITCALLWGSTSLINHTHHVSHWDSFSHNHPLIILGAIGLFCLALSFHFYSKIVNWLAKGVIGVYLIHSLPIIQPELVYEPMRQMSVNLIQLNMHPILHYVAEWGAIVFHTLIVMVVCILIDFIRQQIFRPILSRFI